MKKKLEADLISIAHRILKLKGREDVVALHTEAQKVFEKLAILKFYEENIATLAEGIPQEILSTKLEEDNVSPLENENLTPTPVVADIVLEESSNIVIETPLSQPSTPNEMTEGPKASISLAFEPSFEASKLESNKQVSLEDFLTIDFVEPDFVKVEKVPAEITEITDISFEREETVNVDLKNKTITSSESQNLTQKTLSLNDKLNKGINIGLNDRIAFVKHLFDGSNEEYNRVISQLSTFDTYEEALSFVENLVKPDYNQWENKEEYASRFLHLIEKKFV
jgi:hypothetical protein